MRHHRVECPKGSIIVAAFEGASAFAGWWGFPRIRIPLARLRGSKRLMATHVDDMAEDGLEEEKVVLSFWIIFFLQNH